MTVRRKPEERVEVLSKVPFFACFERDDLRRVVDMSDEVQLPAGSVVVDQGDPGTDCYAIVDGTASVYVRGEYVASSGPGSMVGEMALVDHRPRTATVVADTPLDLMRFDSRSFRTLIDELPKASEHILTELRTRLDRLDSA